MMNSNYKESDKTLTFTFKGRLNNVVSASLADEVTKKINTINKSDDHAVMFDGNIIFDMKEVDYIASSFIRICVSTAKQVNKGGFLMVNCDPFLKKTFKIAGLDELLNIQ